MSELTVVAQPSAPLTGSHIPPEKKSVAIFDPSLPPGFVPLESTRKKVDVVAGKGLSLISYV